MRLRLPTSVFLLLAVLLLACGGGSSGNDSSAGAARTATPPTKPSSTVSAAGNCTPAGSSIAAVARSGQHQFAAAPDRIIDPTRSYTATIVTVKGTITVALDAADAPNTVNNFVFLACDGFYDGLTFWRVVPGFVIQGGDPNGDGTGGPGYHFANEISPNLNHDSAGVISMARTSQPDTNGSQFFITLAPAPSLDGQYNAFGHVTAGQDVVNAIVPNDLILSISIDEH